MKNKTMWITLLSLFIISSFIFIYLVGGNFRKSDTYSSNVSFVDEHRTFTTGTEIRYDSAHTKLDTYKIKTNSTGRFTIQFDSQIEKGDIQLTIKQGSKIMKRYALKDSGNITEEVSKNEVYTVEMSIRGKGNVQLQWT